MEKCPKILPMFLICAEKQIAVAEVQDTRI